MRYPPTHAAPSDSAPFKKRRPKALRTVLSASVAMVFGLTPAVMLASPAAAAQNDLTIAPASAVEGNDVIFSLSYAGLGPADYLLSTGGVTALPGSDYTAVPVPQTVHFNPGDLAKTIHVKTTNDATFESDETFTLYASSSGNGDTAQATGTITDTDSPPTYSLTATSPITESPTAKSTVTATLSNTSGSDTTITLNTVDGTATAADYLPLTDAVMTIPAGQLSATQDISITDDGIKDTYDTETFTVNAQATPVSLPLGRSIQIGIVDAQAAPKLTLNSDVAEVDEGSTVTYTVRASGLSELPMRVSWDAVAAPVKNGTDAATPVTDFPYPSNRTVEIAAGTDSVEFSITPMDDDLNELPEDFAVQLVTPENAVLGSATKVVTEINDSSSDTAPVVATIAPTTVTEGNSGITTKTFTATLDKKSGRTVTAHWETDDIGEATSGKDYKFGSGNLVFPAGTLTQTFTVDIIGDTVDEGDSEDFGIDFTGLDGESPASLTDSSVDVTITDDDAAPTFTFDNVSTLEGDSANPVLLPIKLSNASNLPITFHVADAAHTPPATALDSGALTSGDFQLLNDTVTVLPGATTAYAVVLVNGDKMYETDELAYLEASVDNGIGDGEVTPPTTETLTLTIQNDDQAPTIEVNSVSGHEGDTVAVTGTVTGSAQDDIPFNFTFTGAAVSGSVAAGDGDFTYPTFPLVFIPGGTDTGTVLPIANVTLTEDTVAEPDETILVTGRPVGAIGTVVSGVITILASDNGGPPGSGITLTANKSFVRGGGQVTLSGVTTGGASVQLWAKPYGNATMVPFGAPVIAGTSGAFFFNAPLTTSGVVFAAKSGTDTSDEVTVYLQQYPAIVGGSNAKGSVTLMVTGMPRMPNLLVAVQKMNANGTWSTIGSGKTLEGGTWTHTFTGFKSGTFVTFHALAAANYGDANGSVPKQREEMEQ